MFKLRYITSMFRNEKPLPNPLHLLIRIVWQILQIFMIHAYIFLFLSSRILCNNIFCMHIANDCAVYFLLCISYVVLHVTFRIREKLIYTGKRNYTIKRRRPQSNLSILQCNFRCRNIILSGIKSRAIQGLHGGRSYKNIIQ